MVENRKSHQITIITYLSMLEQQYEIYVSNSEIFFKTARLYPG